MTPDTARFIQMTHAVNEFTDDDMKYQHENGVLPRLNLLCLKTDGDIMRIQPTLQVTQKYCMGLDACLS